jgi:NAD(P)H-dependent flavin oxidoreductase YrpB (nitropropane dioxygenase family)
VAAVATTGRLGMVAATGLTPQQVTERLEDVRARTSGVFGANFLADTYFYPELESLLGPIRPHQRMRGS